MLRFLLSRSAAFSNLKIDNTSRSAELVSDSVEEVVDKLNQRLNTDGEEGVAILTAPEPLGWMALMRYAAERVDGQYARQSDRIAGKRISRFLKLRLVFSGQSCLDFDQLRETPSCSLLTGSLK